MPRELNQRADLLSRIVDFEDLFLEPGVFGWLDMMWGLHTVDRFAHQNNLNCHDSLPGVGALVQKQQMYSLLTGALKTIGGAHQCTLSLGLFLMP